MGSDDTATVTATVESSDSIAISDKLYRVSEATNDDGTVNCQIRGFEEDDNHISVEYYTPTGETKAEMMPFPKKDTDDYKFVRICRETVGSLAGAEMLNTDDDNYVRVDPDSWEIQTAGPTQPPLYRRLSSAMKKTFTPPNDAISFAFLCLFFVSGIASIASAFLLYFPLVVASLFSAVLTLILTAVYNHS